MKHWEKALHAAIRSRMAAKPKFKTNPTRCAEVERVVAGLTDILRKDDPKTKVRLESVAEFPECCGVVVDAMTIVIHDMPAFCDLIRLADNIELAAKTNGKVTIGLTYNGIAEEIK